MKYEKSPLSYEQQAELIISRGMIVDDKDALIKILSSVSYYRLSAYWYPFKNHDDTFKANTRFQTAWRRYTFDRQLRLLVIDAVERLEIAIKTKMINSFSLKYGPFGYLDVKNFDEFDLGEHDRFLVEIRHNVQRSRENFVEHFERKYNEHQDLPIWMAAELMTFGNMLTMFRHLEYHLKKQIANDFGISAKVLESWLKTINYIRNICAHHARLWNRELAIKPVIPERQACWRDPVAVDNNRLFGLLTVLMYMLKFCAPNSCWQGRLTSLFSQYEDISLVFMGFPENWQKCPIWQTPDEKESLKDISSI